MISSFSLIGKNVIVFHKEEWRVGVVRDRPINAFNVMIDELPYVFFEDELFVQKVPSDMKLEWKKPTCICHRIPSKDWHLEECPRHKSKAAATPDVRESVETLFVNMKRQGQGLSLSQEDTIRHAFGFKREVIPLIRTGEIWVSERLPESTVYKLADTPLAQDTAMLDTPREYWPKDYWTWLNIAKHADRDWKHGNGCCDSVAQALKGEIDLTPPIKPVREDITQSEEYKAMLAARGKRTS